ncbi:Zinc finger CCCH domain-containing protein 50 [Triticum urartu]|uniref:Zinc finger CCCH domain-containing protein 50 n=1 Tax=Triticum urartu TaxID=4572 RepID=M8AQ26_TRIUA|nr:Zinc finger CCCH domain-containing protein 50 [Triticum urartu]
MPRTTRLCSVPQGSFGFASPAKAPAAGQDGRRSSSDPARPDWIGVDRPAPGDDEGNRSPSSRSSSLSPITVDRAKKEYPVDPTLPDIKSSVYASDEFRMFAFKVRPCSRAYSHDWTECPFVHPGENARRRDPRKHPYTAVPCPNFRRPGGCPSGDNCEFSHGVFESWLHPTQYRTRLCKEGAACARRICFFAHDEDELRHVPHNSGAGLLSPRATSSIDMTAAAALGLLPGSPRHFVPPPGSPSAVNNGGAASAHWLQGSRLRSSFNARDATVEDLGLLLDWESQYLGALCLPPSSRPQPRLSTGLSIRPTAIAPTSLEDMYASEMAMSPRFTNDQGHSAYSPAHKSAILNKLHQQKGLLSPVNTNRISRPQPRLSTGLSIRPTAIAPTSLEDMYASEMAMSPRFTNDQGHSAYSPAHKSAILNKLHQQKGLLSPVNTNRMYSPRALDPAALVHPPIGGMSPRSPRLMEPTSPMSARFGATVPQREMYEQFSNLNKHQLPSVGSPRNSNAASWGNVGSSPMGKVDWGVDGEELDRLRCPDQPGFAEKEPDAPWGRSLNSNRGEMQLGMSGGMASGSANRPDWNNQADLLDQMAIGAWLEQLQTDQK